MRGKILRGILAVMLLVTFLFTACGKQEEADTQKTQTQSETTSEQAKQTDQADKETEEGNYDPFGKIEPTIEITAVRDGHPEQVLKYPEGDSIHNNIWTRYYENELGIKLKYLWITPFADTEQYTQKLNITIASGDLPDIFLVNKLQFKQLIDSDQIQDLTEVFEKYASEDTKKILTLSGPEPMETAKFGGKLMGLPWTTLFKENVHLLYIRADWMKNLNLPEPKNMDDVLKISEAFTKQDPDQNGKDDTFGFVFEKTFEFHRGFFNSYHAYLDMWIKDDSGNLVFSNIQPEMKKALEALQHLYKTGQIDREFATKDLTKAAESLSSGKAGMFYGPFSIPVWPLQAGKNLDPNMEYNYYPLLSADDKPATPQYSISGILGYWVARKGNPKFGEALVKMMNAFVDKYLHRTVGNNNDYISMEGAGEMYHSAYVRTYKDFGNLETRNLFVDVMKGNKSMDVLDEGQKKMVEDFIKFAKGEGSIENWGMFNIYTERSSLAVIDYYNKNNLFKMDEFYGPATDSMVSKMPNLNKLRDEYFTKIITGASIDEFDKYVSEWKRQGGDDITKEVNKWYRSIK